ncbi:MAG: V-type ATP synthase subunit D [Clostridia bacterium]|nr:V-type ATP synthase subunit D [Clostridia bacterium]
MAVARVNPTRMELTRLKGRLKTATRGHKLLKDKSDEMIRQFMLLIKRNVALRTEAEQALKSVLSDFMLARAVSTDAEIEEAVAVPGKSVKVTSGSKNVMSVEVPSFMVEATEKGETYPYSFATVTGELDNCIGVMGELLPLLIELAEVEKTCNMLADEIEKNRRRVNALEYVMIPEFKETIKYITMKLDEAERANTIRLMKVKSMIAGRN